MKRSITFLASMLILAGCQAHSPEVSEDRFARFFRDLVYGEDFALNQKQDQLQKWTGAIVLDNAGTFVAEHRAMINAQMRHVAALTRVTVEVSDPPSRGANLEFRFLPQQQFLVGREWVPCFIELEADGGVIARGMVTISTLAEGLLQTCLSHEVMHALGFPNHSPILPSILSPLHDERDLTEWDEIALRTLYDERLKPGMTEVEAMPIARQIIRELRVSDPAIQELLKGS